ncbi:hypothetical protein ACTXG5_00085 [Mycobacterium sp. Dal123C01]|uniref:hypothetical protein n=1 Tax=Mycobacterium sp. Dal123C01 TaxID=3457577 RepID=UPI00403EC37A
MASERSLASLPLTGWALGGAAEASASAILVWRFSGVRILSTTAEQRAERGVALSFWLAAPCIDAKSIRGPTEGHHTGPRGSALG